MSCLTSNPGLLLEWAPINVYKSERGPGGQEPAPAAGPQCLHQEVWETPPRESLYSPDGETDLALLSQSGTNEEEGSGGREPESKSRLCPDTLCDLGQVI